MTHKTPLRKPQRRFYRFLQFFQRLFLEEKLSAEPTDEVWTERFAAEVSFSAATPHPPLRGTFPSRGRLS